MHTVHNRISYIVLNSVSSAELKLKYHIYLSIQTFYSVKPYDLCSDGVAVMPPIEMFVPFQIMSNQFNLP